MTTALNVIGIDPGSDVTGYGVIQVHNDNAITYINSGIIKAKPSTAPIEKRVHSIHERMLHLLLGVPEPRVAAVETPFVGPHRGAVVSLCHARGVICLALDYGNVPIFNYSPTEVKLSVTGKGHADKYQIRESVECFLNIELGHEHLDASDALAIAITHAKIIRKFERKA